MGTVFPHLNSGTAMATGYAHSTYAHSLAEFGEPKELKGCGGWILSRSIAGSELRDGSGCYPIFCCRNWPGLESDLEGLAGEMVSICAVLDPFGEFEPDDLRRCFPDLVLPFKEHYVVDLSQPAHAAVTGHHRRNARKALAEVSVEVCARPSEHLEEWIELYAWLQQRRQIQGIRRFSRTAFERQLGAPGLVAFRAVYRAETVGMLLWFVQGAIAFYHLGAFSPSGYQLKASFALFWFAMEHFKQRGLEALDLGGGAGISNSQDTLSQFKSGWASETKMAFFCGRVFDRKNYELLTAGRGKRAANFFPAYRQGEFA